MPVGVVAAHSIDANELAFGCIEPVEAAGIRELVGTGIGRDKVVAIFE